MTTQIGRTREGEFKKLVGISGSDIRNTHSSSQSASGPDLAYPTSNLNHDMCHLNKRVVVNSDGHSNTEGTRRRVEKVIVDGSPGSRNACKTGGQRRTSTTVKLDL